MSQNDCHRENELPRVSVIIPTFNGQAFLAEAINSVARQKRVNFEIIVVDDGSGQQADVEKICWSFSDLNIRLIRKSNGGVSTALNEGLRVAKGKYIIWLSDDDLQVTGSLARLLKTLEYADDNTVAFGDYKLFGPLAVFPGRVSTWTPRNNRDSLSLLSKGLINGCTVMAPRSLYEKIGPFNSDLRFTQDYDMWLRFANAGVKFLRAPGLICESRQHGHQGARVNNLASETIELWSRIGHGIAKKCKPGQEMDTVSKLVSTKEFIANSMYLQENGADRLVDIYLKIIEVLTKNARARIRSYYFNAGKNGTFCFFRVSADCSIRTWSYGKMSNNFLSALPSKVFARGLRVGLAATQSRKLNELRTVKSGLYRSSIGRIQSILSKSKLPKSLVRSLINVLTPAALTVKRIFSFKLGVIGVAH